MLEQILPNLHRVTVPLPDNPLRDVNSYVILTPERNLVIDTGMNRSACRKVLEAAFAELKLDLDRTDFFITHLHSDHIGLVGHFASPTSKIYFNRIEANMMKRAEKAGGFAPRMLRFAHAAGFSEEEIEESLSKHPGLKYHAEKSLSFNILDEGDRLDVGEYNFECIHTPGHSEGHLCLFDAEKKLMVSGDHVLGDISPNISAWHEDENPLEDFLASLDKVSKHDVEIALPGHRGVIKDFAGRVEELADHHDTRLDEVMGILNSSTMKPYDIAAKMVWRMRGKTWEEAGVMQKWFATGEAVAHLRCLEERDILTSERRDNQLHFTRL